MLADVTASSSSPVLVGRARELEMLRSALRAAATGDPRTVLIAGEAGIGKSRLVAEFVEGARRDGARLLAGAALELGGEGLPYSPFTAAIRGLIRETGLDPLRGPATAELARLLPELGRSDEPPPDPETARGRLFEAFLSLVEGLAADHPVVLVIEDLHWADRSTRELFAFLVRRVRAERVLIVATYRSDDLDRRHPLRPLLAALDRAAGVERLTIGRLTRREVAAQATAILGDIPEPTLVERLMARTEGNPLFVEVLLGCPDDLSESLRDLLLRSVQRLSEPAQRVLRVAAAGGAQVGYALLAAVTALDEDELAGALREAVEANVLVPGDETFAFRHALIREAVSDELLPGEKARLHRRYAEALEADPSLASGRASSEIAHHWDHAHATSQALRSAWIAANDAAAAFAHAEQLSFLERVLALWDQVPDAAEAIGAGHVAVLAKAGRAARRAGNAGRLESFATAALAEVDARREPIEAARLLALRAWGEHYTRGSGNLEDLRAAAALVAAAPESKTAARVFAFLAGSEILRGLTDDARRDAEHALALARRNGAGDAESHALSSLALCDWHTGRVEEAQRRFAEALAVAERIGVTDQALRAVANLSDTHQGMGEYERAIEVARDGLVRARAAGLARTQGAFLAINVIEPLVALGRWDEATEVIDDTLDLDPPRGNTAYLYRMRASIALGRGDLAAATAAADQARGSFSVRNPVEQQRVAQLALDAELALAGGDAARAVDIVRGAFAAGEPPILTRHAWWLLSVGGRACADLRSAGVMLHDAAAVSQAESAFTELAKRAAEQPPFTPVQEARRAMFEAERARTLAAWDAAVAALERVREPFPLAYLLFRAAEAAVGEGDRDGAARRLLRARALAEPLRAVPLLTDIDLLARRARLVLTDEPAAPPRPEDRVDAYRSATGLTERELEVLRLLAAGRSNREIGESLFISPKTASVHVSNILTKLDVSSRTAAAAIVHQLRLFDEAAA